MRPIHLSDLHFAACALRGIARADQPACLRSALEHADIADRYRKRLRRAHPHYGLGTLTSALSDHAPVIEPANGDHAYLQSMLVVVQGLLQRAGQKIA
jgi:hypothetical protein